MLCTILVMTSLSLASFTEDEKQTDMIETTQDILLYEPDHQIVFADPCIQPDNGIGTIDLPALCPYIAPDEPFILTEGLPPGTTIELDPTLNTFVNIATSFGGVLGGEIHTFDASLKLDVTGTGSLAGFTRMLSVPVSIEIHTGPRTLGAPVQTFAGELIDCTGVLYGDPDFCTFQIIAGTTYGLPSPGMYTLTEIPYGLYNVDSFFDITYQMTFEGCPGSIIEGMMGTTTGTIRMQQGTSTGNSPPNTPSTPTGETTVVEGIPYPYETSTTDPDTDPVKYGFDFDNDGIIEPLHWTDFLSSGETCTVYITFAGTGTRYLRAKAEDIHGAQSGFSLPLIITVTGGNTPPETPGTPSGPGTGTTETSLTFSTSTIDPDGDTIQYGWDWDGDDTIDEWSGYASSGTSDTRSHTWTAAGTYQIQVKAEDDQGGQSSFSPAKTVVITANTPPTKPNTPTGPSSGKPGTSYMYSASTMDPNGDQLYYQWDFGDGPGSWDGPYSSGSPVSMSHIWSAEGTYLVKVKAKDEHGAQSTWSNPLSVTMPKKKDSSFGTIFVFGTNVEVKIIQLPPGEDYVDLEVLSTPLYTFENGIHTHNPGVFLRLYQAKGLFNPSVSLCFGVCTDIGIIG